jgi:hypothetical protein
MSINLAHYKLQPAQKSPRKLLSGLMEEFGYASFVNQPWAPVARSPKAGIKRNAKALLKVVQKNDRIVGYESFHEQAHPVHALRFFVDLAVQHDYVLRDGLPQFRRPATKVLIYHKLPSGKRDPFKLMRAAAFAGWAMVAISTPAQAEALLQDLDSKLK